MGKKVLVIGTSLRPRSNSDALADSFAEGARSSGNEVERIVLKGKTISFCHGCLLCQKEGECVIHDDMREIARKMHDADVIAFATPIYYYEMSGQMKTMLDRANSLFGSDYRFSDIYLLTTAADTDPETSERAINGLKGWISCFERARYAGGVFGGGVNEEEEIKGQAAIKEAYELGRSI